MLSTILLTFTQIITDKKVAAFILRKKKQI